MGNGRILKHSMVSKKKSTAEKAISRKYKLRETNKNNMRNTLFATLAAAILVQCSNAKGPCKKHEVDFIMLEGDATILAIEDDIRADLEKVGFVVKKRVLPKDEFNAEMVAGNFNFAFSETWGRPTCLSHRSYGIYDDERKAR